MVIGNKPAVALKPLPESGGASTGRRGFRIQMVAELPFTVMDSIVRKKLVGRSFDIEGHKIRVRGARLYGSGTKLVLAATVSGDARGTLYFVGTPVFDPDSQVVSVPDLDFSVESRSVLPEVAEEVMGDRQMSVRRGDVVLVGAGDRERVFPFGVAERSVHVVLARRDLTEEGLGS